MLPPPCSLGFTVLKPSAFTAKLGLMKAYWVKADPGTLQSANKHGAAGLKQARVNDYLPKTVTAACGRPTGSVTLPHLKTKPWNSSGRAFPVINTCRRDGTMPSAGRDRLPLYLDSSVGTGGGHRGWAGGESGPQGRAGQGMPHLIHP